MFMVNRILHHVHAKANVGLRLHVHDHRAEYSSENDNHLGRHLNVEILVRIEIRQRDHHKNKLNYPSKDEHELGLQNDRQRKVHLLTCGVV